MSAHVGDLGDGSEEEDGGLPLRGLGLWINSSNADLLMRPALRGRKTHRGWYSEVLRHQGGAQTEPDDGRDAHAERDRSNMADAAEASSSARTHSRGVETTHARLTRTVSDTGVEGQDPFWVEVRRSGVAGVRTSQTATEDREEEGEAEEEDVGEGGSGVTEVQGQTVRSALLVPVGGDRRTSRREKNRARCLRRRQRKRERRHQQQESQKSSTAEPSSSSSSSSSSDEDDLISEGLLCAVCLDVYFCPYMCHPCSHIFCEPCLRTLAKNCPTNTPCPLCRTIITHVFFQKELNQTARTFFPKEYLSRKQNFQKAACAKWPLPSCRKLFRMFGGFPRQWSPMARRRFPPRGGTFRVDPLELEELGERSAARWRLDMDMVIIYIYSVNWIIGFVILCLLCYIFFPSP